MLILCAGAWALAQPKPAASQVSADQAIDFNIPAQSLDGALAAYFRATGVQLLYDSQLTASYRSAAVKGRYTPREALRRLIDGTGLVIRYTGANAAIITKPQPGGGDSLVPLGRVVVREELAAEPIRPSERLAYYSTLEYELQRRLSEDERTERLTFTIAVELTIGPSGSLDQIRIQRGSGNRRTDAAVTTALEGATLPSPPRGLAQPLAIVLRGTRRQ